MANFRGFGGNMGGMGNMQQLMKQAQKMQEDAMRAKEEVDASEHEGAASGGLVSVVVDGNSKLKSIKIDPAVVDPDDVEMLEDLVLAAYGQASEKAEQYKQSKLGNLGGLM